MLGGKKEHQRKVYTNTSVTKFRTKWRWRLLWTQTVTRAEVCITTTNVRKQQAETTSSWKFWTSNHKTQWQRNLSETPALCHIWGFADSLLLFQGLGLNANKMITLALLRLTNNEVFLLSYAQCNLLSTKVYKMLHTHTEQRETVFLAFRVITLRTEWK